MKYARALILIVGCVVLAGTVQAQTVNWSYAEGGWAKWDPDRRSSEDGWFLGGAVGLGKIPIHVFGEFGDYGPVDIWQVGAGWHGLLGKRADLFADGALYDTDFDDGLRVRFGIRWMVTERLELNGYLSWIDLDFGDNKSAAVGAVFGLGKHFGVGGTIEWGDEFNTGRVFARFNFGPTS